jgi:hypothetical protein
MAKQTEKKKDGRRWFDGKNEAGTVAKLEYAWALGCSDSEAASFAEVSKFSVCRYLKAHPALSQRKEMLLEMPNFKARKAVIESFEKNPALALQYLERKKKDEFAPKQEVDINTPGGFSISVSTADDKNKLAANPKTEDSVGLPQ